ncbi:MAG: CRISPR-associated protein Cas4 [Bacillota bacterium]
MDDEQYVPLYALNAYLYCPHRMYREYVLNEWADNHLTVDARYRHARADSPSRRTDDDQVQSTRVWIKSEALRVAGIADVVEETAGLLYPVEYKRGRSGLWDNDRVQLCAQALCLEEQLHRSIDAGYVFYFTDRRREQIPFTAALREKTVQTIERVRAVLEGQVVPPAVYSVKCRDCSIQPVCLPLETQRLKEWRETS